ncbi:hypothetical protein M427DRAFT_366806 [Gonapodya prolifera JEL478]|uniref:Uncharacterized protein n=1 Tax=Gonapodya prolifera (strain JEL478) TaxID=1344416 RepID=A0A139A9E7_GONPJ|nr:hypothetical protein M427DRAFT_366806 [Gonapodya prolifera JEL478]|eukprot:KXS13442.1 hypothetical protein M427DRAFT_366806 [Gonapodya prolifera JEL478]
MDTSGPVIDPQLRDYRERMRRRETGGIEQARSSFTHRESQNAHRSASAQAPPIQPRPEAHHDPDFILAQRLQQEEEDAFFREQSGHSGPLQRQNDGRSAAARDARSANQPSRDRDGDWEMLDTDRLQLPGSFVDPNEQQMNRDYSTGATTQRPTPLSVDARSLWERELDLMRSDANGQRQANGGNPGELSQQELDEMVARQLQAEEEGEEIPSAAAPTAPRQSLQERRPVTDPRSSLLAGFDDNFNAHFEDPFFSRQSLRGGRVHPGDDFGDNFDRHFDHPFFRGTGVRSGRLHPGAAPIDPFDIFGSIAGRDRGGVSVHFGDEDGFTVTRDNFGPWRDGLAPRLVSRYGRDVGESMLGEMPMTYEVGSKFFPPLQKLFATHTFTFFRKCSNLPNVLVLLYLAGPRPIRSSRFPPQSTPLSPNRHLHLPTQLLEARLPLQLHHQRTLTKTRHILNAVSAWKILKLGMT